MSFEGATNVIYLEWGMFRLLLRIKPKQLLFELVWLGLCKFIVVYRKFLSMS